MPSEGVRALSHAVRLRVVGRYVGELGLVLGAATLVPATAAVVFGELDQALAYFLTACAIFAIGMLTRLLPAQRDLQRHEAIVVTALAFTLSPVLMSVPMLLEGIPWEDAVFEAVSGITTTGLSTLDSVEARSRTFLLARAWLQWVGGLGFVVLSVALILGPGIAARRLGDSGLDPSATAESMRSLARRSLVVYLGLSALGVLLLLLLGAGSFDAVVHTMAAVSTGGFSPRDSSLADLVPRIQWGVLGVSLLGAVSLSAYVELGRGRWQRLTGDVEVRALLALVLLVGLGLLLTVSGSPQRPVSDLALLAISAQTTTGFATFDVDQLPAATKVVLIVSMLTGGCLGSTAGGIKILRILILLRLVQWLVARTRLPAHAISSPTLAGQRLEDPELLRAAAVALLFLAVQLVSWIPFLVYGYDPVDALFEVTSATGTVGLSVGLTRRELEPLLKGVLCMDMLLGRLEVFALLVALAPRTWLGRR